MIDHLGVQVADVEASARFFTQVLGPVGVREEVRIPIPQGAVLGFGTGSGAPQFWISAVVPGPDGTVPAGRESHLAFSAVSRSAVEAVHEAAVEAGAEILHAPREWPEYHPGYYAVFFRDLDGNNVEAVCHVPG